MEKEKKKKEQPWVTYESGNKVQETNVGTNLKQTQMSRYDLQIRMVHPF